MEISTFAAMQPFFILSTGRAGSTFLARALEQQLDGRINLHQTQGSRTMSIAANFALDTGINLLGSPELTSTVDPQQSMLIYNALKHGKHSNAKVVVLIRDPRDFVMSMMNWKNRRLQSKVSHHLIPFWSPVPMFHGVSVLEYALMSKFEHFAWTWNFKNRLFLSLRDMGIPILLVKSEDMTKDQTTLNSIFKFLEIEIIKDVEALGVKNASDKSGFPHWRSWSAERQQLLEKHCQPLMGELGYGYESEWKSK